MRDVPTRRLPGAAFPLLLLTLFVLALPGCHLHDPHGGGGALYPVIEQIGVDEYDNVGSHLEVEVHLYDAYDGALIGCSGKGQGLAHVDEAGVIYRTHAYFVRPFHNHARLAAHHVDGRDLYVRVFEDDAHACPAPVGPEDDFIGQSGVFAGEELFGRGLRMAFDDVLRLDMAVSR